MHYERERLVGLWREHAAVLRRYGAEEHADVLERCIEDVEAEESEKADRRVDLAQASIVTGFTRGHLRRLIATGKLRNVGTSENPEFMLSELPRKPGYLVENKKLADDGETRPNYPWQAARAALFHDK